MSSEGSVSRWFNELQDGDSLAAQRLWERYYPTLVRLARYKLQGVRRGVGDEEDIALSVLDSLFRSAQLGRFPDLADRHDLWQLLLQITACKVIDFKRHELRQRRGGGHVVNETDLQQADLESKPWQVVGDEPTPELAAMMVEQLQRLMANLADSSLQAIARAKLEGYTNQEIAQQLDCSIRTVERRLHLIRKVWQQDDGSV